MDRWSASSSADSDYSDEEVGVLAGGRRLWVRGVRAHTTCSDLVQALLADPEQLDAGGKLSESDSWVLAERWRGVERPLPGHASVLDVLNAWGDARHEVRLSLRCLSDREDSGRDSPCSGSARRARRRKQTRRAPTPPPAEQEQGETAAGEAQAPAARLVSVIQHQSRTIHQQLDKLRDQEKQIDQLEDQTHKSRMEKHGSNYLLESYLRDLGRCNEVTDSQAGNSDSGVGGGSGTPPRRHTKHKSRRERHLMREHYFTKELTDICQINSERLTQTTQNDTDSETSMDELVKIREEIELLEKMAIINKRLHREEELVVRLSAKVRRYIDENKANSCESKSQITVLLERLDGELTGTAQEMEKNALELERADLEIEERMKTVEELTLELEEEDLQNQILERELQSVKRQPINLEDAYTLDEIQIENIGLPNPGLTVYPFDTLV